MIPSSIYSLKVTEKSKLMLDLLQQFNHTRFSIDDTNLDPRVLAVRGTTAGGYPVLITWDVYTRTPLLPSSSITQESAKVDLHHVRAFHSQLRSIS